MSLLGQRQTELIAATGQLQQAVTTLDGVAKLLEEKAKPVTGSSSGTDSTVSSLLKGLLSSPPPVVQKPAIQVAESAQASCSTTGLQRRQPVAVATKPQPPKRPRICLPPSTKAPAAPNEQEVLILSMTEGTTGQKEPTQAPALQAAKRPSPTKPVQVEVPQSSVGAEKTASPAACKRVEDAAPKKSKQSSKASQEKAEPSWYTKVRYLAGSTRPPSFAVDNAEAAVDELVGLARCWFREPDGFTDTMVRSFLSSLCDMVAELATMNEDDAYATPVVLKDKFPLMIHLDFLRLTVGVDNCTTGFWNSGEQFLLIAICFLFNRWPQVHRWFSNRDEDDAVGELELSCRMLIREKGVDRNCPAVLKWAVDLVKKRARYHAKAAAGKAATSAKAPATSSKASSAARESSSSSSSSD